MQARLALGGLLLWHFHWLHASMTGCHAIARPAIYCICFQSPVALWRDITAEITFSTLEMAELQERANAVWA